MRILVLFVSMLGFWALLSGQLDPHHNVYLMGAGVVCCAAVTWICVRLRIVDADMLPIGSWLRLPRYAPYLLKEVVLSNMDVFKRVMSHDMPISPRTFRVPCTLTSDFAKTVYANSITLTPGTVVIAIDEQGILIHALTAEAEAGVRAGIMEKEVARLESHL